MGAAAKGLGLATRDVVFGSYYLVWLRERRRREDPAAEMRAHAAGKAGVLAPAARRQDLDAFARYLPLAWPV